LPVSLINTRCSRGGAAAAASVQISINKLSQKMAVTIHGVEKYVWLVSTGVSGYSTRECLATVADNSLSSERMARELDQIAGAVAIPA
jgi:hypothetical protein